MKFIESLLKPNSSVKDDIERVKAVFLSAVIIVIWALFLCMSILHFFAPYLKIPIIPILGVITIPISYLLNKRGKYKTSAYLLIFLFVTIHTVDIFVATSPVIARKIYLLSVAIILTAMLLELSDTLIVTLVILSLILVLPLLPTKKTIHYHSILHPLVFNLLVSVLLIHFSEFSKKYRTLHQQNIEQNYQRFRILFDNMPVALWEYDGTELIKYFSQLKERGITDLKKYLDENPEALEKCYNLLKVTDANQKAIELYQFKNREEFTKNINNLFKKYNKKEFKETLVPFFNGLVIDERERKNYTTKGEELIVLRKILIPKRYQGNWKHITVAAVDITNFKKLQQKLQQRANFLELILKVAKDINKELNMEKLFLNTVKTISETLGFYNCSIWILEDNYLVLKAFAFAHSPNRNNAKKMGLTNEKYPIEGIIGWAITDNEIKYVSDVSKEPHYINHYSEIKTQSECAIPLRDKERVIGALDIQSDRVDAFSKADIEVFSSVADQISVAIRNAILYNEILKRAERLEAINDIGRIINNTLDTDTVIEKAYLTIKETFNFEAFYLALYDEKTDTIDYKIVEDKGIRLKWGKIKLSETEGSASYVIRNKKNLNIRDVSKFIKEHIGNKYTPMHGEIPKKLLAIPLRTDDKIIGVISVQSYEERDFNSEDETFLSTIADQIATALKNARLYNSLQKELNEREKLEYRLLQSQKLEAIGRLAGGIAHEFNNILTAIIGNVDLLLLGSGNEETTMELMEIRSAAERAAILTGQLLAFGKKQLIETENMDINEQIIEMKETFLNILGGKITLILRLTDKNTMVRANSSQLNRALINIVTNAKESMPDGGTLIIKTETIILDKDTTDTTTPITPGKYVVIKITDTGVGIDKNILPRIFDPFFTTKKFGEGSGLGLSIAYGIIKQFGGEITASSTPGKGTAISIYLPAIEE